MEPNIVVFSSTVGWTLNLPLVSWKVEWYSKITFVVFSHIAAMMASADLNAIIASLQMAFILMDKLPDVYRIQFRREGNTCLAVVSYLYSSIRCLAVEHWHSVSVDCERQHQCIWLTWSSQLFPVRPLQSSNTLLLSAAWRWTELAWQAF